jgi:hypothetical protein
LPTADRGRLRLQEDALIGTVTAAKAGLIIHFWSGRKRDL